MAIMDDRLLVKHAKSACVQADFWEINSPALVILMNE